MKKNNVEGFAFIGRTFLEYCEMFNLTDDELSSYSFLDCPAGACSFTAEVHKRNIQATAVDCEYGLALSKFLEKCEIEIESWIF
ncbi:MAG: hypothetical protein EXS67_01540 [Candidatus Margulisbacteria bacterium]|nr:hypothetical protein [Candidatus Margulisiibacteriota bacterium]